MMISDEQVMAYVDGELDARARAEVEQAAASDLDVARRIARQRALREKLRAAFDDVLNESPPERLVAAARNAPVTSGSERANVAELAQVRAKKAGPERAPRRWSWPEWSAIAASVALGAIIAQLLWHSPEPAPFTAKNGRLVAQATLADALTNQLASTQSADVGTHMGVSFRSKSGDYCRTFVTREGGGLAGLACHQGSDWTLQALSRVEAAPGGTGTYSAAGSSLPTAVLQTLQEQIAGEPLDAAAEAAARGSGWR